MTPLPKPDYDPTRNTIRVWHTDGPPNEYRMYGGICWPFEEHSGVRINFEGHAVVCGLEVRTKDVHVFSHTEFSTVDPQKDKNQVVIQEGVAQWLNRMWSEWYCLSYYWHGNAMTSRNYRIAVSRSPWCRPKPQLIEAKWQEDEYANFLLLNAMSLKKFSGPNELISPISMQKNLDKKLHPPRHAILCAMIGMETHPWKEPVLRPGEFIKI